MLRRTKIVATIGPATESEDCLTKLIIAGVNVVRLNMSHGVEGDHQARLNTIRKVANKLNKEVGILVDLPGPKIRIAKFKNTKITLNENDKIILDSTYDPNNGTASIVGIDYKDLPKDVAAKDILLLDDGRIILEVESVKDTKINCITKLGGVLSNNKGINRQGGGLSADAITEKDKIGIKFAAKNNVDFLALSFPREKADIELGRKLLYDAGGNADIVAKIERCEAIDNLDEIIESSDAVMVARGDLGVEIGFAELPAVQKHIISRARTMDRAVITATQMMESMIENSIPTRAEVTDVANAVFQGTDAVMLSAETATGNYPVATVEHMAQVCLAAERQRETQVSQHRLETEFHRIDEAIAMASMYTANHLQVGAIVSITETGRTPLCMSRIRSGIPIYGVSRNKVAIGKMTLYRGVYPVEFDITKIKQDVVLDKVLKALKVQNIVKKDDKIIITRGDLTGVEGGSNSMKIVVVE